MCTTSNPFLCFSYEGKKNPKYSKTILGHRYHFSINPAKKQAIFVGRGNEYVLLYYLYEGHILVAGSVKEQHLNFTESENNVSAVC